MININDSTLIEDQKEVVLTFYNLIIEKKLETFFSPKQLDLVQHIYFMGAIKGVSMILEKQNKILWPIKQQ